MIVSKAVITAAGRDQRTLPIQTLIDRDGTEKAILRILVDEAHSAGIDEVAVVVAQGDEGPYSYSLGDPGCRITFIPQPEPRGYGYAIYCAREFTGEDPFLHLVGDHLYVSGNEMSCARQLVDVAKAEDCAVSAVQSTRESLLPYFGTVGGRRVQGRTDLYLVETVIEKPTPTEAELRLMVPGLRTGHYLCFFGMHVLTPAAMEILGEGLTKPDFTLSEALSRLAAREKYLALEERAFRYDIGAKYGLLTAQLALALSGCDRAEVLTRLLELMAQRDLGMSGKRS
jgi:UTP--glucose-1-phosphate uridylyltransferase